jgi:hypothetical protein
VLALTSLAGFAVSLGAQCWSHNFKAMQLSGAEFP